MSGIVFYRTEQRERVVDWYLDHFDVEVWIEQPGCTILVYDGFRFGFCDGDQTETEGILTFVYDTTDEVDDVHRLPYVHYARGCSLTSEHFVRACESAAG
ncbi:hypothetical protein [Halolamina sp.]|jgi:hypothetical protein|uniref:hypothetical protein n=1 Tax=Halolamina sp. TaxID=1940283 RepID=UPI000223BC36|nr:hypothetical protein Halar_2418 [halophilic archaeon DL31]